DASLSTRSLHSFPTRRSSDLKAGAAPAAARRNAVPACDERQHGGARTVPAHGISRLLRDRGARRHALLSGQNSCRVAGPANNREDRKSTRLNSSHVAISYAVF